MSKRTLVKRLETTESTCTEVTANEEFRITFFGDRRGISTALRPGAKPRTVGGGYTEAPTDDPCLPITSNHGDRPVLIVRR